MACYRSGGCGPYEMMSCSECPASKPEYCAKAPSRSIKEIAMAEYIEREALLNCICMENCNHKFEDICENCYPVEKIMEAPVADVVPVVHGRWIEQPVNGIGTADISRCSVCNYPVSTMWNRTNYCPNCGAKMGVEVSNGVKD